MVTHPAAGRVLPKAILPVANMEEALSFWQGIGFDSRSWDGGYALVRHQGQELLHLRLVEGLDPAANPASAYLHVASADDWHAAWSEAGVALGAISDEPWGMREFSFRDPSGNLIRVGNNL
jgi:catechol 2,3-dioxygenase-like lactoylglutathione lyase family enzyme